MISHPMRLDSAGGVVTVGDHSLAAAAETALHVIACARGERPLAPPYGLTDPVSDGVSAPTIQAALELCEPEISVRTVRATDAGAGRIQVQVDVEWSQP